MMKDIIVWRSLGKFKIMYSILAKTRCKRQKGKNIIYEKQKNYMAEYKKKNKKKVDSTWEILLILKRTIYNAVTV